MIGIILKLLAGAGGIGGLIGASFLGILPQIATAAMAVLRGALDIVTDLAQSEFGRHILGALMAGILALYVYHAGHQDGLTEGRAEVHSSVRKCPQIPEPSGILDFFIGN